ncbi:unnamed protein product [Acanthoscelides obtectus]|uniref:Uncharacterized protein n=1 Tax=Acanthoscelides obtectus TaxID=200917 RepID=A0A9P0KW68_ACAOB|nr:unnamed protein product [Acanthoscelides obtectus]CAK1660657.1 Protein javelin [Acanthoscelides obtectus]
MNILKSNDKDTKEFKDRLGSMRSYWCKMTGSSASHTEGETCNEDDKKNDICKIVEVQTKVDEVKKKFEQKQEQPEEKPPSKVQLTKQLFEPKPEKEKVEKISPVIKETCNYFENNAHLFDTEKPYESLCPANVEIVEAKPNGVCSKPKEKKDETDNKKCKVTKSKSIDQPEFDHVRYKIVKSDLFQKKIFANCEKESQFDGLIEYLQNYSFQELLIDNNIVIIEPIRSKVPYEPSECVKSMRNVTPMLHKSKSETQESEKSTLNKHFFYRPIRVNKEVNDDELPNPDTVRQVREFFEGGVKKSRSNQDILANNKEKQSENTSDPDKDRCSATDTNSHSSNISDFDGHENLYDSIDNEIYCEYVSEDILEKIRERGSTVTYYGGRVVKQNSSQPLLTKTIMEEIQNNEKRCNECNNCIRNSCDENQESFIGMKFRILKSNSCSSRLELVGTESLQESRRKMMTQHRKTMNQGNLRRKSNVINEDANNEHASNMDDKNAINEHIKKQNQNQPKIIGEEMKLQENKITQWKEIKKDGSCNNVNFNEKRTQKIYDYYHYDKMKSKSKKIDDMEFEPYEVAG